MKKVYFLVSNDLSYDQRMQRICASTSSADYEVQFIGRELPESPALSEESYEQIRLKCHFNASFLFYLELNLRLFFYLLKEIPQSSSASESIIHAVDSDTLLATILLSWWRKFTLVYDAHEYFSQTPELRRAPLKRAIWEGITRRGIRHSQLNITVNTALAERLGEVYHREFQVLRNCPERQGPAVKLGTEEIQEKITSPIFLYQGAINEGRGIEQYISVMEYFPSALLWIIGEGPELSRLRALAEQKDWRKRISFFGYMPPGELQLKTREASIGLNALDGRSESYRLSLANRFFDYLHAGIPALHMPFPAYENIMEQYPVGLMLESLSVEELRAGLERLLTNSLYTKCHRACREAAEIHNWEEEEKKLLQWYGGG